MHPANPARSNDGFKRRSLRCVLSLSPQELKKEDFMGKKILTKKLLLRSVEEWNAARKANPDINPDLCGVDLRGAYLNDVDLHGATLCGADLTGAHLIRAYLGGAYLSGATLNEADLFNAFLSRADLSSADLIYADLRHAGLMGADLSSADLMGADLSYADLSNANLSNAKVAFTTFGNLDLSSAIGLDAIKHNGPSTIGIDTIYLSNGNIPEAFLRGCGVPDNFIEYARSLTANGIEYYSCFISYSHKNEEFAKRLHTDLQANNVRCWFAPHDLPIGAKTRPAIDDAIRIHDKLLLILSEQSVQSNWVEHEVEHALDLETEREKLVLFPVRLDDAVMDSKTGWASNVKRQRNIGDFTKWKDHDAYQEAFKRLLRDLKQSEKPKK